MHLHSKSAPARTADTYLLPKLHEFCLGVLETILKFKRAEHYVHKSRMLPNFLHGRTDVNHGPETHPKECSGNTQDGGSEGFTNCIWMGESREKENVGKRKVKKNPAV